VKYKAEDGGKASGALAETSGNPQGVIKNNMK
jgi:hypothetical protein